MLRKAVEQLILTFIGLTMPNVPNVPNVPQEPFGPPKSSPLSERLAAAVRRAVADAPGSHFWTAYAFDPRPGVAVDADLDLARGFSGRVEGFGGTEVFFGNIGGEPARMRSAAIFALHRPGSGEVERVEIFNLDKQRHPDGRPIYWLGRASGAESLGHLRRLVESGRPAGAGVKGALAVALHDDPGVGEAVKNFARQSADPRVREASVHLLGLIGAERAFLADLARNAPDARTRVLAVRALALFKDRDALEALRANFAEGPGVKVKMALIDAASSSPEREAVVDFLLGVAAEDPEAPVRQHAVYTLGKFDTEPAAEGLTRLFRAAASESAKQQVLYSLSRMGNGRALASLLEAARGSDNPRVRAQARHFLKERAGKRFAGEGSGQAEAEFKAEAERVRRERPQAEAVSFLIEAAQTHPDAKVRKAAVACLSQIDDPRVVDFFRELLSR